MKRRKSKGDDGTGVDSPPSPKITPSNTKRAIAVGKIVAPVLLPVVMRAAGTVRGAWDEHRARVLGVPPGELHKYSGRGGFLTARINRVTQAIAELRATGKQSDEARAFITDAEPRLVDLAAAIRAAEFMPTERRRAAFRSVAAELDQIEPRLLHFLGLNSPA
ncbi:MAG TPA: DUF6474 family protein [Pseudonocardia sp.]|jgi:hypothetical protein|nr:DUF6474 family protein [Pseudonocardia sp.]